MVAQHTEPEQSQQTRIRLGQLGQGAFLPPPHGQEDRQPTDAAEDRCLEDRERPEGHLLRYNRAAPEGRREKHRSVGQAGGGGHERWGYRRFRLP